MLINFFNIFEVIDVTKSDCEKALGLPMDDYEDALIATCAERRRIELIITRNLKDFANHQLKQFPLMTSLLIIFNMGKISQNNNSSKKRNLEREYN